MITKICKVCSNTFIKPKKYSQKQWQERITCSNQCSVIYRVPQLRGRVPWNKGTIGVMKGSTTTWKKKDPRISGMNNYQWQGDYPSYHAVHKWVYKNYGKAIKCEFCGDKDKRMYHWSNISGEYKRDRTDWQQLCVSCHSMYDKGYMFV